MEGNVIKSGALTLALPKVKNSSVDVQGGKYLPTLSLVSRFVNSMMDCRFGR